ncbi:MAG: cell wall-binding repeat-containing protein [Solirubrobacteraceae bacterium]
MAPAFLAPDNVLLVRRSGKAVITVFTKGSLPSLALLCTCVLLGACGGGTTKVLSGPGRTVTAIHSTSPGAVAQKLGFPAAATKNTTRVNGADPVADAAAVALAVYPSAAPGTHPRAVTIAPTGDWQAAIAGSVLMASPIRAPILLSGGSSLPPATADALGALAPTGSPAAGGAQVIRVGDVPSAGHQRTVSIAGTDPYALAASIDRFASAARGGRPGINVVIASGEDAASAMPAAGWAAESGEPVLFVTGSGIPGPTRQALISHQHPHIYVLGAPSVISDEVLKQLRKYGSVKRIGDRNTSDPAANSVAFAEYRDPPCGAGQPCAHVPGSFGWAMRSPGHGYVLLNAHRPLDAAAASPLSASGDFGAQLLVNDPSKLPPSVLNFFLNFATPGYTRQGPTAAVYNHGWVIGNQHAVSLAVQAELDLRLEVVPQQVPK